MDEHAQLHEKNKNFRDLCQTLRTVDMKCIETCPESQAMLEMVTKVIHQIDVISHDITVKIDELIKLQDIIAEINSGIVTEEVLDKIFTSFADIIPYDRIGCALLSDDAMYVEAIWSRCNYEARGVIAPGYKAPLKNSSLEGIIASGVPRIINDLEAHYQQHQRSVITRDILEEGILSSLTCPLVSNGKYIGFLFFSSRQRNTYTAIHTETFTLIARHVALLIEKSRLYEHIYKLNKELVVAQQKLKQESERDALTDIYHRGAVLAYIQKILSLAYRKKMPVSILMVDVDFFKKVNDIYGHQFGDVVLKNVAAILKNSIRSSDAVGRYGGEEFILVLVDADYQAVVDITNRLTAAIRTTVHQHNGQSLNVTVSIGVCHREQYHPAETLEALINQADLALYEAKRTGRDKTVVY